VCLRVLVCVIQAAADLFVSAIERSRSKLDVTERSYESVISRDQHREKILNKAYRGSQMFSCAGACLYTAGPVLVPLYHVALYSSEDRNTISERG